jgi:hypothetical protein
MEKKAQVFFLVKVPEVIFAFYFKLERKTKKSIHIYRRQPEELIIDKGKNLFKNYVDKGKHLFKNYVNKGKHLFKNCVSKNAYIFFEKHRHRHRFAVSITLE